MYLQADEALLDVPHVEINTSRQPPVGGCTSRSTARQKPTSCGLRMGRDGDWPIVAATLPRTSGPVVGSRGRADRTTRRRRRPAASQSAGCLDRRRAVRSMSVSVASPTQTPKRPSKVVVYGSRGPRRLTLCGLRQHLPVRSACWLHPITGPDVLDDLDELVEAVALAAGEVDELSGSCDDGATFGGAGDRDAAAASELEQALVAE